MIRVSIFSSLIVSASDEIPFDFGNDTDIDQHNIDNNDKPYGRDHRFFPKNVALQEIEQDRKQREEKLDQQVVLGDPLAHAKNFSNVDMEINNQGKQFSENQKNDDSLNNVFDQELDKATESQNTSSQKSVTDVIVSGKDRAEIKNLVDNQLRGKLSEAQIRVVETVTNSYLEQLFKKLLKRSIKGFIRKIVNMIFTEVRSAEKKNNAISERDMWVICRKIYDKELALEAAKKVRDIKIKYSAKKGTIQH